jgi:hypothetical protein
MVRGTGAKSAMMHLGFDGITYNRASQGRGQFGSSLLDPPRLGENGVTADKVPGLSGLPGLGYALGRPVPNSVPALQASVGCAESGKIATCSSFFVCWTANNYALTDSSFEHARGLDRSDTSRVDGDYVMTAKVSALVFPKPPGGKRTYLSSAQHHSWDVFDPPGKRQRTMAEQKRDCGSMLHNAGCNSPPAPLGVTVFGKRMCETCFERSVKQTRCSSDMRDKARQRVAAQSATDLLPLVAPKFAAYLKPLLSKFRWWMAIACLDPVHFAAPVKLDTGVISTGPMEMHAAAIVDHPLSFQHIYRKLKTVLLIDPTQPAKCMREHALALTDVISSLPELALHGYTANADMQPDGSRRGIRWIVKPKLGGLSPILRWYSAADVIHPHVALLVVRVSRNCDYVITRECARILNAILLGQLIIDIDLVPALQTDKWRSTGGAARTGTAPAANLMPIYKVANQSAHVHPRRYVYAEELTWNKLYNMFKHHLDSTTLTCASTDTPIPPLRLRFCGSLTRAVRRVTRRYGEVVVTSGAVFETLVHAASVNWTTNIKIKHGSWSDPLMYANPTDEAVGRAAAALEQEISLLATDPQVLNRFDAAVATMDDRHGFAPTTPSPRIDRTPATDRSVLWDQIGRMTFLSETNSGNLGFDEYTRTATGGKNHF